MNITIVTTAYKGYGQYADQWLSFIAASYEKPTKVIIALGKDHGLVNHKTLLKKYSNLDLQFHFCESTKPLMGPMRNEVINEATTEWVMYLSIDDMLLPNAIAEFQRFVDYADYICISWESITTWNPLAPITYHEGKTPERLALRHKGHGFIVGHSPFRRSFWVKSPYMNHDYPNAPFVADMIKNGARFASTDLACTRYLRRMDSHAARLGRRGVGFGRKKEKVKARYWKRHLEETIREYYS